MDEKRPLTFRGFGRRPSRVLAFIVIAVLCTSAFFYGPILSGLSPKKPLPPMPKSSTANRPPPSVPENRPPVSKTSMTTKLVPLEAHIMSKCPDARDCLREMILPAMQRVYDKVNFTLSFVGEVTHDNGVDCMHGPAECMGNIIELCAAELYPDPKTYLGFTMCITRQYMRIPDRSLMEDCALEHAIDIKKLNDCAAKDDGAYGMHLLKNSVTRTSDAGVTKSCTVRLDNEIYCIMDGGEWKDCPKGPGVSDLVIAIEKLSRRA